MTKKFSTKKALIASILSLALCFTMLVGTTFAWFTDSVTSSSNIIKTGTLDIEMYWADGTKAVPADDSSDWTDASTGAIFNYDKWEPGYVEVRHIKIYNNGSLALKYKVDIVANGEVSDLSDAIDVYYVDPAVQVADRADLTEDKRLGTLTEVLAALGETGNGTLEAGEDDTITIAFKMRENAGNEYQDKSIGSDFSVQLLATQHTSENDSFDNKYDANAAWLGNVDTSWYDESAASFTLATPDALAGLSALVNEGETFNGKTVTLGADLDLNGLAWTPIGTGDAYFAGTFDGAGHSINGLKIEGMNDAAFFGTLDDTVTVKNVKFTNVNVKAKNAGVVAVYVAGSSIENVHVLSGNVTADSYGAAFAAQQAYYGATFKDCTNYANVTSGYIAAGIGGYIWYDCFVENCVNYGNIVGGNRAGGIAAHADGVFTNCTNNGEIIGNGGMPAGGIVAVLAGASTFEGCVNNGNVTNNGTDASNSEAAGIIGNDPSAAGTTVKNCVNNGDVLSANGSAAGIANSHYGSLSAVECENNGDVQGKTGAAGIIAANGKFSGTNTVTDCTDNGTVTVG